MDLTARLYVSKVSSCVGIAQTLPKASHDRLTRRLMGPWSGHTRLDRALRTLCQGLGGYLSVDDTLVEQPYAPWLEDASWVWSSTRRQVVFGIPVVLLVWTDGQVRLPLALRIWKKGGPAKCDVALELCRSARHRLRRKPRVVLCEAWSPAKRLLKRLRDDGWYVVGQVQTHRPFAGRPWQRSRQQPYWQAVGVLSGGLKVRGVKYRRTYDVTNRLHLTAQEVRALDQRRHESEDVLLKRQLGLETCQAGDKRGRQEQSQANEGAQAHPVALGLAADLILARERWDHGLTLRQRRRNLIVTGLKVPIPSLKRVRAAA